MIIIGCVYGSAGYNKIKSRYNWGVGVLAYQLPIREIAGSNLAVGQSDIGFSSLSLYR